MYTSARVGLILVAVAGALFLIPAIAWRAWLRRPRPRSLGLLVVALATTAPFATALAGVATGIVMVRSFDANEGAEPSEKARRLAETISETMNGTAIAVIAAAAVSGVVVAMSLWRNRGPR